MPTITKSIEYLCKDQGATIEITRGCVPGSWRMKVTGGDKKEFNEKFFGASLEVTIDKASQKVRKLHQVSLTQSLYEAQREIAISDLKIKELEKKNSDLEKERYGPHTADGHFITIGQTIVYFSHPWGERCESGIVFCYSVGVDLEESFVRVKIAQPDTSFGLDEASVQLSKCYSSRMIWEGARKAI